jgi:transposase-like protein
MGKQVSGEQKKEIVLAVLRKEEAVAAIARRHQVSEQSIYRWQEAFIAGGIQAVATRGQSGVNGEIAELKKQLEDRDRVIGEYAFANSFLKKDWANQARLCEQRGAPISSLRGP